MNYDQTKKFTDDMVKEARAISLNAKRIAWYMRGGVTYTDIFAMSHSEIDDLNKIIDDNLETTKKTKIPFI